MEQGNHNSQFSTLNSQLDEYKDIRPYEAGEMKQAFEELLADRQFQLVLKGFAPWLPKAVRNGLLRLAFTGVKTPLDFQKRFMKPVVKWIIRKHTDGCSFKDSGLESCSKQDDRYTFVSNHRDIVLDSAFLDVMLVDHGHPTTVEIGIGDNLLIYPWIKRLVRMNKAFTVRRGLTAHEMMRSSQLMSSYIHYAVTKKKENIWIAQREGRAKDSDDRTQESVLKMLAMGGTRIENSELRMENSDMSQHGNEENQQGVQGNHNSLQSKAAEPSAQFSTLNSQLINSLRELNIVPLTISYEYDPCDYLKAQEFQMKRDNPAFKKSRQDDLDNMKTGIFGYKGRVHYQCAAPINTWIDELAGLSRKDFFATLAARMDRELHRNYRLYPCNYIAYDMLSIENSELRIQNYDYQASAPGSEGCGGEDTAYRSNHNSQFSIPNSQFGMYYSLKDKQRFEQYLQGQLDKIQIPNKDEAFLRERMLTMYANPVRNYLAAL